MGSNDEALARASPASLIAVLDRAVPGFKRYTESDENLHSTDSFHGVFSACTSFVWETRVAEESWRSLAQLLNELVRGHNDDGVENAACTCFLENLADRTHPLRPFLRGKALDHWMRWEPPAEGSRRA